MKKIALICAALLFGIALSSAQTAVPHITKRQHNQQARIAQGVRSGQLTRGEARRLERQQAKIQRLKRRAKADGIVTQTERARLSREQDRASKRIYRMKHNRRVS